MFAKYLIGGLLCFISTVWAADPYKLILKDDNLQDDENHPTLTPLAEDISEGFLASSFMIGSDQYDLALEKLQDGLQVKLIANSYGRNKRRRTVMNWKIKDAEDHYKIDYTRYNRSGNLTIHKGKREQNDVDCPLGLTRQGTDESLTILNIRTFLDAFETKDFLKNSHLSEEQLFTKIPAEESDNGRLVDNNLTYNYEQNVETNKLRISTFIPSRTHHQTPGRNNSRRGDCGLSSGLCRLASLGFRGTASGVRLGGKIAWGTTKMGGKIAWSTTKMIGKMGAFAYRHPKTTALGFVVAGVAINKAMHLNNDAYQLPEDLMDTLELSHGGGTFKVTE